MMAPCKDCDVRTESCHSNCINYALFQEELKEYKSIAAEHKRPDREFDEYKYTAALRTVKKKKNKPKKRNR